MMSKDDRNIQKVLATLNKMDEPVRSVMLRMHEVIVAAAPELKVRIWYGMPGYATSASSPILVFFRNDERMTLGVSEQVPFRPTGGNEGRLMPSAWYFDQLDEITERRVAEIVRAVLE